MRQLVVCLCLAVTGVSAQQSAPQTPSGAISGTVVDGVSGRPISGAFVQLQASGPGAVLTAPPRKVTDTSGRFIFSSLPAGDAYIVLVTKPGYLDAAHGRTPGESNAARITLGEGDWRSDISVDMWRTASISGTVTDERGEPVVGAPVQVVERMAFGRGFRWVFVALVKTDDRGAYRFGGLSPGDYLVHAPMIQLTVPADVAQVGSAPRAPAPRSGSALSPSATPPVVRGPDGDGTTIFGLVGPSASGRAYSGTFHPATRLVEDASVITLAAGDQRSGIDVRHLLHTTVTVAGRVVGPPAAITRLPVRLLPQGAAMLMAGADIARTQTDASGAFVLRNVPEGDYVLVTGRTTTSFSTQGASTQQQWLPDTLTSSVNNQVIGAGVTMSSRSTSGEDAVAMQPLSVGRESITDVVVQVEPAVTVSGTLDIDSTVTADTIGPLGPVLRIESVDATPFSGSHSSGANRPGQGPPATGSRPFRINNVAPGRYMLSGLLASALYIDRAEWNGQDLLDTPLVVEPGKPVTGITLTLGGRATTLDGTVVNRDGQPAVGSAVLVFPDNQQLWPLAGAASLRFKATTVDGRGRWQIRAMPPGGYLIVAVPAADRNAVYDADRIAALAADATSVRLSAGGTVTSALRITGGGR